MTRAKLPWWAVISLVLLPLLVKSPLLAGLLIADPAALYGEVGASPKLTLAGQAPTLDPNIAFTSHALGSYAARAIASGQSPWWNPLEGIGTPLAGEMQSAALFPPTWLLLLPDGQLLEHLLFQVIAGLATFALLRQLRVGIAGAWVAGVLFEFNGVYAWLANAVVNPVCFLPVVLLGVERVRAGRNRSGGLLIAGGLAASIYAGFPEVAYLDGLLIAAWVICRVSTQASPGRWRFLATVAMFGAAGVLLAGPLLVAFVDFLRVADVGVHGDFLLGAHIDQPYAASVFVPYFLGNLFGQRFLFWANIGGYAGLVLPALAIAGALGARDRSLRLMLAGWSIVTIAVVFGVWPLLPLFHLIPLTAKAAVYRYLDASWIMAMCVLAGMAVEDLRTGGTRRLQLGVAATVFLAIALIGVAGAAGIRPGHSVTTIGSVLVQIAALAMLAAAASRHVGPGARRTALIAAAAGIEGIALFAAPLAAYSYRAETDLGGIAFLRASLGLQRFVTLGPIAANYGSYYGIAEVNHNDLPVPSGWTAYARRHLDPRMDSVTLQPLSAARLLARLPAYAAIGTRYVVAPPDRPLPGLAEVHADRAMRIYAVPSPRAYLSAPGCAVAPRSRTEVAVTCAAASSLTRLENFMPGWRATVDGRAAAVSRTDEVFQAVAVPKGPSLVRFAFVPPGLWIGFLLAAIGASLLFGGMWWQGRRRIAGGGWSGGT